MIRALLALALVGCVVPPDECDSEGLWYPSIAGPTCVNQPDASCRTRFGGDADLHACSATVRVTCSWGEAEGLVSFDGQTAAGSATFPDGCVYEVRFTRGETP